MVSFKLGAKSHFFATFFTFISTFFFCAVGSHMRISVTFVFIFVVTVVAVVPTTFGMGFHMTVQISNALKLFVTTLFWVRQFVVNVNKHVLVQSALKWETFPTKFTVKLQFSMGVTAFIK